MINDCRGNYILERRRQQTFSEGSACARCYTTLSHETPKTIREVYVYMYYLYFPFLDKLLEIQRVSII